MHTHPQTGFARLPDIIGDRKATPPKPAIFPVSASAWWAGVRNGKYPKGIKLSSRCTVWRWEDIHALIAKLGAK